MRLHELAVGEGAIVKRVLEESRLKQRLVDVGMVPGTKVVCVLESPGKDPKAYEVKGALLAIREEDAQFVEVERIVKEDGGRQNGRGD